jgi:oligopeptide transport system substrate-binding protein
VHAVDDKTLVVDFESPHCDFRKACRVRNVCADSPGLLRGDARPPRGADADTLLYNGPFKITTWVHGAHLRLRKNPGIGTLTGSLNVIDFPYLTARSALQS